MACGDVQMESFDAFWGTELSSDNKLYELSQDSDDSMENEMDTQLEIRGACLGVGALPDENNLVQLTAENGEGEEVKHVIMCLNLNRNPQVTNFLSVRPPIKLELIQGSGPVHIVGQTMTTIPDFSSDEEDSDSDEEEKVPAGFINAESKVKKLEQKKRPAESQLIKTAKSAKMQRLETVEDNEEESDEDEDTNMDNAIVTKKPAKKQQQKKQKEKEPSDDEEDSDDDDDNEDDMYELAEASDDDDDDMEDDMDDDDEDESEEEVKPPSPKKAKSKKIQSLTPQPTKPSKGKTNLKTPQTVQPKGKGSKPNGTPSVDEIKKKLLQSPNIPKKLEKFNNYVANTFKVNDNGTKKQLWEYVQKNRK